MFRYELVATGSAILISRSPALNGTCSEALCCPRHRRPASDGHECPPAECRV